MYYIKSTTRIYIQRHVVHGSITLKWIKILITIADFFFLYCIIIHAEVNIVHLTSLFAGINETFADLNIFISGSALQCFLWQSNDVFEISKTKQGRKKHLLTFALIFLLENQSLVKCNYRAKHLTPKGWGIKTL